VNEVISAEIEPTNGELGVSEVTAGKVQEYRVHRATTPPVGSKQPVKMTKGETPAYKPPSRSTLHDEVVTLRLVLKTAIRHSWLDHLPDLSPPYQTQGKIVHRPWFSPDEYKQLYQATRESIVDRGAKLVRRRGDDGEAPHRLVGRRAPRLP
jgi:hypothetical protein